MAKAQELDLVEISSATYPPICKIFDLAKFKYQQKKKQKLRNSNQNKVIVKTIVFSPTTDDHDVAFKTRHAIKFLQDQAKVDFCVYFSGRKIKLKEKGISLLKKVAEQLAPYGNPIEEEPRMEGRRMIFTIAPLKKK